MKTLLRVAAVWVLCSAPAFSQDQKDLQRARLYEPFIAEASVKYNVDANLIWTIAYLESRFRPELVSPKGAMGLMQLIPATAARYGLVNPYDPKQSIEAAAQYLRYLLKSFDGHLELVLAAYNAGEQAVIAFRDGRTIALPKGKSSIRPAGGLVVCRRMLKRRITSQVELPFMASLRGLLIQMRRNRVLIAIVNRGFLVWINLSRRVSPCQDQQKAKPRFPQSNQNRRIKPARYTSKFLKSILTFNTILVEIILFTGRITSLEFPHIDLE